MVSSTELILVATLVQTAVITLTLLVFIFQFRAQERALKESSYQSLIGRYNDFIMTQATSPELNSMLLRRIGEITGRVPDKDQWAVFANVMITYGICEEAYEMYSKKWIDAKTWEQWASWLKALSGAPEFELVHNATRGMFDEGFQGFVDGVIRDRKAQKS